jgi:pyrimidine operon attenuation protein/uracil phosphoribosyltransferase
MKSGTIILDKDDISRIITRMALEILESHKGGDNLALLGIQTRGVFLARRLKSEIEKRENVRILIGELDISLYRDDWTLISKQPVVKQTDIPFSVKGKKIILVDDVLFTGRTVRAAMDAVLDYGRPARIELAVLADRGHREFPIQADYFGKYIETDYSRTVNVLFEEYDNVDRVILK